MKRIGVLLLSCLLVGCLSRATPSAPTQRWTAEELVGHTFTLVDAAEYARYTFKANGDAIATIGQVDGPLAGIVMKWQITREGALVISDETSHSKWSKLEWDKDRVVVNTDIGAQTYVRQYQ